MTPDFDLILADWLKESRQVARDCRRRAAFESKREVVRRKGAAAASRRWRRNRRAGPTPGRAVFRTL